MLSMSVYTVGMPLTMDEIRKNCTQARERMGQARAEHWAFGAFNLDDEATLRAVAQAAAKQQAPVLVEVSQGEVDDIGLDNVRDLVDNFKCQYGVEIYINLDHSPSVEAAKDGIEAGFEFIHIDVSQANHDATDEEIMAATQEIVEARQGNRRPGGERAALLSAVPAMSITKRSTTTRSRRLLARRKAPRLSSPPPALTPLRPPSATCTANIRCRKFWTWNCCNGFATPSIATFHCTAAATHQGIISRCCENRRHQDQY